MSLGKDWLNLIIVPYYTWIGSLYPRLCRKNTPVCSICLTSLVQLLRSCSSIYLLFMYIGNKNVPGVIEILFNNMPKHSRRFSLFFGGGGFELAIPDGLVTIGAEPDPSARLLLCSSMAALEYFCYKDLLADFCFTSDDFVFADPPYRFSSRRSKDVLYSFEFSDSDHLEFLELVQRFPARVMVCHPKNDMYDNLLAGWYVVEYDFYTRGGVLRDAIYMNYDISKLPLQCYHKLGSNFIDRQRIARSRRNIVSKFQRMDLHMRAAVIEDLRNEGLLTIQSL